MRSVAVLAYDGVSTFGLGVTAEVFGCDRSAEGLPRYDYVVTAATPGLIRTDVGLPVLVSRAQELLECTDRGIEQVAAECGLSALMLRLHFARRLGITPQAYRRRFTQLAC